MTEHNTSLMGELRPVLIDSLKEFCDSLLVSGDAIFAASNPDQSARRELGHKSRQAALSLGAVDFKWTIYGLDSLGAARVLFQADHYPIFLRELQELIEALNFGPENVDNRTGRDLTKRAQSRFVLEADKFTGSATHTVYRFHEDDPWMVEYSGYLHNDQAPDLTIEEFVEKFPQEKTWFDKLYTWEELEPKLTEYYDSLVSEPKPIDRERYWDMLEVLPPCKWRVRGGVYEAFHVSERLTGNLVSWFVEVKTGPDETRERYEFVDYDTLTDEALVAKVEAARFKEPGNVARH